MFRRRCYSRLDQKAQKSIAQGWFQKMTTVRMMTMRGSNARCWEMIGVKSWMVVEAAHWILLRAQYHPPELP